MPRVKHYSRGKFGGVYTPKGKWQGWAQSIATACRPIQIEPHDGPVRMVIEYRMPRPKSLSSKIHDKAYCWRKPDIDNMEKLVLDVLKKIGWFTDDGRVSEVHQRKVYSVEPGMFIGIELLDEGAAS